MPAAPTASVATIIFCLAAFGVPFAFLGAFDFDIFLVFMITL